MGAMLITVISLFPTANDARAPAPAAALRLEFGEYGSEGACDAVAVA